MIMLLGVLFWRLLEEGSACLLVLKRGASLGVLETGVVKTVFGTLEETHNVWSVDRWGED